MSKKLPAKRERPTLKQLRARRDEILRLAAAHNATNVRVFGSVARGDATEASDVDLVIDLPDDLQGFAAFGTLDDLRRDVEQILACSVDIVTLRGPFSARGQDIAQAIARDAQPL